jgi:hypothetical protein
MEEHSLFLDWVSSLASNTDDADQFLGPRPEDVVQFPTDAPDVDNVAGALRDLHRGSDDMGVRISRIYIDVGAGRVAALDVYPSAVDGHVKLVAIPRREAMMAWPRPKPVRLQAPYASLGDLLEMGKVWTHPPGRGPAMVERATMPDKTRPIPLGNLWGPYDAERPICAPACWRPSAAARQQSAPRQGATVRTVLQQTAWRGAAAATDNRQKPQPALQGETVICTSDAHRMCRLTFIFLHIRLENVLGVFPQTSFFFPPQWCIV